MRRIVLSLLVLGLGGLVGCGGTPSKSSFLADADDACRAAGAPVASLPVPSSFPDLATSAGKVAVATDEQVPRLRQLDRPGGDKDRTDAVFNALSGVATAAKSLQSAADKKDERATAQATNDMSARAREAGEKGRGYGFTACGSSTETAANAVAEGARKVIGASFVLKAEARCDEASEGIDRLPEVTSLSSLVRYMNGEIPILTDLVADLEALVPPPGREADFAAYLEAQKKVIEKGKELKNAAQARNERLAVALDDEGSVLVTAANNRADELGLRACGTESAF